MAKPTFTKGDNITYYPEDEEIPEPVDVVGLPADVGSKYEKPNTKKLSPQQWALSKVAEAKDKAARQEAERKHKEFMMSGAAEPTESPFDYIGPQEIATLGAMFLKKLLGIGAKKVAVASAKKVVPIMSAGVFKGLDIEASERATKEAAEKAAKALEEKETKQLAEYKWDELAEKEAKALSQHEAELAVERAVKEEAKKIADLETILRDTRRTVDFDRSHAIDYMPRFNPEKQAIRGVLDRNNIAWNQRDSIDVLLNRLETAINTMRTPKK